MSSSYRTPSCHDSILGGRLAPDGTSARSRWQAALAGLLLCGAQAVGAHAAQAEPAVPLPPVPDYGPNLERFDYPYKVGQFNLASQGQVPSASASPASRRPTSSASTNWLPIRTACWMLGVERAVIMGHSMGGMLASRYALMYPDEVDALVMVNPIGLEDWKAKGVPYRSIDQWYERELKANAEGMKKYQQSTYYAGTWRQDYDKWVLMAAGMLAGEGRQRVAWNQALTYDMIYTQPVVHEFGQIRVPTLLLIGEQDNTAPGKDAASPEVAKTLGNYRELGPATAQAIPGARLVAYPELGHSPQIQDPKRFHRSLLEELDAMLPQGGNRR